MCDNNRGGDLYMLSLLLEDMFSIYNLSSRSCRERSVYLKALNASNFMVFSKALFELKLSTNMRA